MKNWLLLGWMVIWTSWAMAQQVCFSLANPQIINGGTHFQFDVMMRADAAGSYYARGQVYLNYNTAAFGSSIHTNNKVTVAKVGVLNEEFAPGAGKYNITNVVDNNSSILAIAWASNFLALAPSTLFHTPVPTVATPAMRITIAIADNTELAGISFQESLMNGQQFELIAANDVTEAYANPNCYENNSFESAALPVELLAFTAKAAQSSILLDWEAAQEVNFAGYEIERAAAQQGEFSKIAWVPGKGSTRPTTYRHEDTNVRPGVTYTYRLKLLDTDGSYTYSDMRNATLAAPSSGEVKVVPNPARDQFVLHFNLNEAGPVSLVLFSELGQPVYQQTYTYQRGDNQWLVNIKHLPAGLYRAQLRTATESRTATVQVSK